MCYTDSGHTCIQTEALRVLNRNLNINNSKSIDRRISIESVIQLVHHSQIRSTLHMVNVSVSAGSHCVRRAYVCI